MKNPFVSVIVPVYNIQSYIKECVDSLINQSYKNIEIILIDDGSTDDSGLICDEYKNVDNLTIIHKKNGGLSDARNVGIEIARGDYLIFVDGDDFVHRDFVSSLVELAMRNNSKMAMIKYFYYKNNFKIKFKQRKRTQILKGNNLLKRCGNVEFVVAWNKIYYRDLFHEIKYPYDKIHEDVYTTYKLLDLSGKCVVSNSCLYAYRVNDDSITKRSYSYKRYDEIEGLEERLNYFADNIKVCVPLIKIYLNQLMYHYSMTKKFLLDLNKMKCLENKYFSCLRDMKNKKIKFNYLYYKFAWKYNSIHNLFCGIKDKLNRIFMIIIGG